MVHASSGAPCPRCRDIARSHCHRDPPVVPNRRRKNKTTSNDEGQSTRPGRKSTRRQTSLRVGRCRINWSRCPTGQPESVDLVVLTAESWGDRVRAFQRTIEGQWRPSPACLTAGRESPNIAS